MVFVWDDGHRGNDACLSQPAAQKQDLQAKAAGDGSGLASNGIRRGFRERMA